MTPEGKIKVLVSKALKAFPTVWKFMPVQMGYGAPALDFLICYRGRFIAIETKAPGKKTTDRQDITISNIRAAGGKVFVVDSKETLAVAVSYLERITVETVHHHIPEEARRRD